MRAYNFAVHLLNSVKLPGDEFIDVVRLGEHLLGIRQRDLNPAPWSCLSIEQFDQVH